MWGLFFFCALPIQLNLKSVRIEPNRAFARTLSLTPAHSDKRRDLHGEAFDLRVRAPERVLHQNPTPLASPQTGNDFNSVSQDWIQRQTQLITGGAEQQFLADINHKMNSILRFEEVDGEPYPESGDDPGNDGGSPDIRSPGSVPDDSDERAFMGLQPSSLSLVSLNRLQLSLKNRTRVSCSINGAKVQWDISRPLNRRFDVNLSHQASDARSTLNLNYNW